MLVANNFRTQYLLVVDRIVSQRLWHLEPMMHCKPSLSLIREIIERLQMFSFDF